MRVNCRKLSFTKKQNNFYLKQRSKKVFALHAKLNNKYYSGVGYDDQFKVNLGNYLCLGNTTT